MRRKEEAERNEESVFYGTIALAQTQSLSERLYCLLGMEPKFNKVAALDMCGSLCESTRCYKYIPSVMFGTCLQ